VTFGFFHFFRNFRKKAVKHVKKFLPLPTDFFCLLVHPFIEHPFFCGLGSKKRSAEAPRDFFFAFFLIFLTLPTPNGKPTENPENRGFGGVLGVRPPSGPVGFPREGCGPGYHHTVDF
jgi:hypothetical protein